MSTGGVADNAAIKYDSSFVSFVLTTASNYDTVNTQTINTIKKHHTQSAHAPV